MHSITGMGGQSGHNWAACFALYVERWNEHRFDQIIGDISPFDVLVHATYMTWYENMTWYERMTRRYISFMVQTPAGVVVPIRRPAAEPADEHSVNLPIFQPKASSLRKIIGQT